MFQPSLTQQSHLTLRRPAGWVSFLPAGITILSLGVILVWVLAASGWDPLVFARLGTRYSLGDQNGSQGYDGQFSYFLALDPRPDMVAPHLDVPAYRYQRILLPLLARGLALGRPGAIPWTLVLVGLISHAAGTWTASELLAGWGVNRLFALVYGLWAGFVLAVRLDLPEPLAYALVGGAILATARGRPRLGWLLYGLALFAKEVTILFIAAQLLADLFHRRWRPALGLVFVALVPYAVFQLWLWGTFGQPGVASGGAMATSFELIPFMGLLRIGYYSPVYLLAMLVVFVPAVVLPTVWGLWAAAKRGFSNNINVVVLALLLNALAVMFLPFSTFRETGGLLRFTSGLVLAVLLFSGQYHLRRVLNLSVFWLVLNVFLLKS
jgi:hypothetical protein